MRGAQLALAVAVAVAVAVSGCDHGTADRIDRQMFDGMSSSEIATAHRVALHVAQREHARVSARATASGPRGTPADDAAPCTGRVLHIVLNGTFGRLPKGTGEVTAQRLTVDAVTGHVCSSAFSAQGIVPDLESVSLFST